ncbi:hypothetical protein DYB32_009631, partial [Aphanomyces invadans]
MCLTSIVFHMTFLVNALPAKHPLLASSLFGDVQMAAHLRSKVTLLSTTMQPTGIPPHVGLHLLLETNLEAIRALPNEVREGVAKLLEDKGVTAGNITQSLLEELLKKAVNDVLVTTQPLNTVTIPAVSDDLHVHPVHFWGGRWHLLPEDFELPSDDVATGWHLWCRVFHFMRNPVVHRSATEGNKLRKKSQGKAKKTAPLKKFFRCLKEDISADKVQQDLGDALKRVVDYNKYHFQTFYQLIEQATDLVDRSILNEVDNNYKAKLRSIIKSRGYNSF